jgi:uncharacterized Zn finger protein (UPF0148 family)
MTTDKCPKCGTLLVTNVTGDQRLVAGDYVEDIVENLYCPVCEWNDEDNDEYPRE